MYPILSPQNAPLADVGGIFVPIFYGGIGLLIFIPIVLVEAVVLWLFKWDTFWKSIIASLRMNLISGVIGLVLFYWIPQSTPGLKELFLAFLLTLFIEVNVLMAKKKVDILHLFKVILVANVISYIGLFILFIRGNPRLPEIPKTEIVYAVDSSSLTLGFMNSNGSEMQFVDLNDPFTKPYWPGEGEVMYLLEGGSPFGEIFVWEENKRGQNCENTDWWRIYEIVDLIPGSYPPQLIINKDGWQLLSIDPRRCVQTEMFVDEEGNQLVNLLGGSLSPDGRTLLYAEERNVRSNNPVEYSILRMDLETGETVDLGFGANPVWSPGGDEIAYLGLDGIYVMSADGGNRRRIVEQDFRDGLDEDEFDNSDIPEPQWSPDGQWLLYHIKTYLGDYNWRSIIYKVAIDSGEVVELAEDGLYPYWRK